TARRSGRPAHPTPPTAARTGSWCRFPPPKARGAAARQHPPPADRADIGLLEIGYRRQVELAGRDESGAAPAGAEPSRIDPAEVPREPCRMVAREGVAVSFAVVRVVVPQVEREHALGDADADIPGGVAVVRNAVRIRRGAAGSGDLGAVEVIARTQEPVAGFTGPQPSGMALVGAVNFAPSVT